MAFYNIHNLRVGVAIDNDINGINKGEFSFSKGYLAALAKASKHGKMNWLSEIKNHRKVHILPKLED